MKDLIDIDSLEDNVEDNRLSNKPLDKGFYLILLLSVYNYLDYTDFFIFIWSKGVGKGAIAVITVMFVTAGTLLIATAETVVTPGTRLNQISLSKSVENTSSFKVRFYNDIIVIKKLNDIDIMVLNDKVTMPGVITLEIL